MIPANDGAPVTPMCEALTYTFTKVWNEEAHRQAFRNMKCKPAGYQYGTRMFKITADFIDRSGRHWEFEGLYDKSGYPSWTSKERYVKTK